VHPTPRLDPKIAEAAQQKLLEAITDLLEQAVDECVGADALARAPEIMALCGDVIALAAASEILAGRSAP